MLYIVTAAGGIAGDDENMHYAHTLAAIDDKLCAISKHRGKLTTNYIGKLNLTLKAQSLW